jgi:hypothetical protein
MLRKWHKVAGAALVVGVGGLAIALPAHASRPSVELEVCNSAPEDQMVYIRGTNQNDDKVTTSFATRVKASDCAVIDDWWWGTGTTLTVQHNSVESSFDIPRGSEGRFTVDITATGP